MAPSREVYEFLGPAWLTEVRRVAQQLLDDLGDTTGVDFTMSEELTDPAAGRARTAAGTLGWFLRVRGGTVEVGDQPSTDADLRVTADYATHHDLSRRICPGGSGPGTRTRSRRPRR